MNIVGFGTFLLIFIVLQRVDDVLEDERWGALIQYLNTSSGGFEIRYVRDKSDLPVTTGGIDLRHL